MIDERTPADVTAPASITLNRCAQADHQVSVPDSSQNIKSPSTPKTAPQPSCFLGNYSYRRDRESESLAFTVKLLARVPALLRSSAPSPVAVDVHLRCPRVAERRTDCRATRRRPVSQSCRGRHRAGRIESAAGKHAAGSHQGNCRADGPAPGSPAEANRAGRMDQPLLSRADW